MNLYKSLIFILYLGIFLGSGFRTPAQSRDSITLYGTLDTVQVIRQRIQHANEANAGARVTIFLQPFYKPTKPARWPNS